MISSQQRSGTVVHILQIQQEHAGELAPVVRQQSNCVFEGLQKEDLLVHTVKITILSKQWANPVKMIGGGWSIADCRCRRIYSHLSLVNHS